MKDLVLAVIMFICALIDGVFAIAVASGAVMYGADTGAIMTIVLVSGGFGLICLIGGIWLLLQ